MEQLLSYLAADAPAPLAALAALADRNARTPAIGDLYQEITKRLAATHREAALGYQLRYLHSSQARFGEAKPLAKTLHKQLFPLPGQAERFQVIVNELALSKKLDDALAKVPTVYVPPRKKIELDRAAIHAARDQHAGTVELLNEYLRASPRPPKPKQLKNLKPPSLPKLPRQRPRRPGRGQRACR